MTSLAFPKMFKSNHTVIYTDHDATVTNLMLTLQSTKGTLFGDPDFGTNLRKMLFNQNDGALADLIVNDIYTAIQMYVPQLVCKQKDIYLYSQNNTMYVSVQATNLIDYTTDMYNLALLNVDEEL